MTQVEAIIAAIVGAALLGAVANRLGDSRRPRSKRRASPEVILTPILTVPDPSFLLPVACESKRNLDGRSRQTVIKACRAGDPVTLVREPDNPHDANAVRVDTRHGTIGYVARDNARRLAREIDAGEICAARIHAIHGGTRGKWYVGVVLAVTLGLPTRT